MDETTDGLPRSDKLANILRRHQISAASYSRMPVKLRLFYVGRSPRATLDDERAWLRELHEHAEQQRAKNNEVALSTVRLRRTKRVATTKTA